MPAPRSRPQCPGHPRRCGTTCPKPVSSLGFNQAWGVGSGFREVQGVASHGDPLEDQSPPLVGNLMGAS